MGSVRRNPIIRRLWLFKLGPIKEFAKRVFEVMTSLVSALKHIFTSWRRDYELGGLRAVGGERPEGGRVLAPVQRPHQGSRGCCSGRGLGAGEIRFTELYTSKPSSWAKRGPSGLELFILHKSRPSQARCEIQTSGSHVERPLPLSPVRLSRVWAEGNEG